MAKRIYKCQICEKGAKGLLGLSKHLKNQHDLTILDYKIQHCGFIIPKCECGKNRKQKNALYFYATCGNETCVRKSQSVKRLKYMKENPHKTGWRTGNISWPEKVFKWGLIEMGFDKKYNIIREYSVFPYYIDFAFINEKVAVEIDGSQHLLEERLELDTKKDIKLTSEGWRVYRVTANQVKHSIKEVLNDIEVFIGGSKTVENCGIKEYVGKVKRRKERCKKERSLNGGFTDPEKQNRINRRTVDRPPYEQLMREVANSSYVKVAKKYGVSDKTIPKWIKFYQKYENKS